MRKLNTCEFINKAFAMYGNKYDYSLVNYVNSKTKIKIICSKHGTFEQTPNSHLCGCGCPKCGDLLVSEKKCEDTDHFISRAIEKHGHKYDYSLVDYINVKSFIVIICCEHGKFSQRANDHLNGKGCPICGKILKGIKIRKNTDYFINEAKKIHGKKYNYSNVDYVKSKISVSIICSKHGMFNQKPNDHLNGKGCPTCCESNGENKIRTFLNENNIKYIKEKKFSNCINVKELPFDFYLPEYDVLIEFDGVQHFNPINYFGGIDALNNQIINDKIKNDFARVNNFHLLRIRFDEINEINKILNTYEPIFKR